MRTKVTADGLLIPKTLLEGIEEVEIRQEHGLLVIVPVTPRDPILTLGAEPVESELEDASVHHDDYLYKP